MEAIATTSLAENSLKQKLEAFQNLVSWSQGNTGANEYKTRVLDRLNALKNMVQATESKFLSDNNATIAELQRRLDVCNVDFGFRQLVNIPESRITDLINGALLRGAANGALEFVVNDGPAKQALTNALQENGAVLEYAESELANFIKEMNKESTSKTQTGSQRGLLKNLAKIKIQPSTENATKLIFEMQEGKPLPSHWIKTLEERYSLTVVKSSMEEIRTYLNKTILENIQFAELRALVETELNTYSGNYDLNKSEASIKGFLGEVHTTVFLKYLFPNAEIRATGNLRTLAKREEIPIDVVMNGVGFQIKNYSILRGAARFTNSLVQKENSGMGMSNFVTRRLRAEEDIAKILIDFFGAYQYNQPIEGVASEGFKDTYNKFGSSINGVKSVFDNYIDNILKVSDVFGTGNDTVFGDEDLYFNTFFVIADKIVPSSAILQSIINLVSGYGDKQLIDTSYSISQPIKEGPKYTLGQEQESPNYNEFANYIKVNWNIFLRVEEIVELAIRSI